MLKIILLGIAFGIILQRSRVNTFDRIGGFAMLRDFTVPKVMLTAIAVSSVLLFAETTAGLSQLHLKPLVIGGVVAGGVLFGVGMAILGYCPGTLIVSAGEGALDAVIALLVGVATGALYVVLFPTLKPLLGPNLGTIHLLPSGAVWGAVIVVVFAACLILLALALDGQDS